MIVPLFALANGGVVFGLHQFEVPGAVQVGLGVIAGLAIGKVVGIVGATFILVRATKAQLPKDVNWRHVTGMGLIAGIGFTLSIFIAELAFTDQALNEAAKMSIFVASFLSAILGLMVLWRPSKS